MSTVDEKTVKYFFKIASTKQRPSLHDYELISSRPDLFSLAVVAKNNTNEMKQFFLRAIEHLIVNDHDHLKHEHFLHAALSITDVEIPLNSQIFAFMLTFYLTSDHRYDEYMRMKRHNTLHKAIIVRAKRVQKCLEIIYNICVGKITNHLYFEIVQNICTFNGSTDPKELIKLAFDTIVEELTALKNFNFFVIIQGRFSRIHGFIIHEILDCGNELERYVEELATFIEDTDIRNYLLALENYSIDEDDKISKAGSWAHLQFKELSNIDA